MRHTSLASASACNSLATWCHCVWMIKWVKSGEKKKIGIVQESLWSAQLCSYQLCMKYNEGTSLSLSPVIESSDFQITGANGEMAQRGTKERYCCARLRWRLLHRSVGFIHGVNVSERSSFVYQHAYLTGGGWRLAESMWPFCLSILSPPDCLMRPALVRLFLSKEVTVNLY